MTTIRFSPVSQAQLITNRNRLSCLIYFLSCSVFLFAGFYFVLNVNIYIALANMASCFFGSYIASLLEFNFSKRICIKYETELVAQGIDQKIVDRKKYFGERYEKTFIEFCINPTSSEFSPIRYDIILSICSQS